MNLSSLFLFCCLLFLHTTAYTVNEYEIRDLESVGTYFTTEAAAWIITNKGSSSASATTCAGTYILGGYQVTSTSTVFQRTYTPLPTHDTIYFSLSVWVLDLLAIIVDSGALYTIYFDNVAIATLNTLVMRLTIPSNVCGGSGGDYQNIPTSGQVSHSAGSVTLKIQLTIPFGIPQSTASIGFRDVNLLFANTGTTASNSMCGYSLTSLFSNSCLCGPGKYNGFIIFCDSCDPSCGSCNGPSADECQACNDGYSWNGSECFQCQSGCEQCNVDTLECLVCETGGHLYWDGTCRATCDLPLVSTVSGENKICSLPCPIGKWYYSQGGTCEDDCPLPLVPDDQGDLKTCSLPCDAGKFLDWNGQCRLACVSPLEPNTENGVLTCSLPCEDPLLPYYYPSDLQCHADCDLSMIPADLDGFKTCSLPCLGGDFLRWDGSCNPSCDDPLIQYNDGILRCKLPCAADKYFSLDDSQCYTTCNSPLTSGLAQGVVLTCDWTCTIAGQYLYWDEGCQVDCDDPLVKSTENTMDVCLLPCPIGKWFHIKGGTCENDCPLPLVSDDQGDLKTCSMPCPDGDYFGWDGNCKTACDDPLIQGVQNGVDTCELPCVVGKWYHSQGATCEDDCLSPLVQDDQGDLKICSFPCPAGQHLYWDDICRTGCASPLVPSVDNTVDICSLPCPIGKWYYFEGTSCEDDCLSPLIQDIQGDLKTCSLPCPTGQHLYWDDICRTGCASPLVPSVHNTVDICSLPCPIGKWYYSQGATCEDDCLSPLVQDVQGDLKTCSLPCPAGEFLYWNDECHADCDDPLIQGTENTVDVCSLPCPISQYFYSDDTCDASCSPPLKKTIDGDLRLCDAPCPPAEFFFFDESRCIQNCDPPLISEQIGILKACRTNSPSNDDEEKSQLVVALQAMSQTTSSVAVVNNLLNPGSSTSLLVLMLFDLLNYIQYMEITFPSSVEALFDADSDMFSISFSFEYNTTLILESELPERKIPEVFQRRDLHSSFIINNWDPLTSMVFAVIAVILYYPVRYLIGKMKIPLVINLMNKLEKALRWNLFLTFLVGNYAEITLYCALEFVSFRASSFLAVFSLLTAIFMIIVGLNFLWKMLHISKDKTNKEANHNDNSNEPEEDDKWDAYEPLYEPYKNDSMWTQSYMFVLSVRIILCYAIIAALYQYPVFQSVILSLLSLLSLVYILIFKPMNELRELIENIVFEIIILTVNICVIVLAVLESREGDYDSEVRNLGTVIVVLNTAARILATIFVFWGVCAKLYEFCQKNRKHIKKLSCWNSSKKTTLDSPDSIPASAEVTLFASIKIAWSKIFEKQQQKTQSQPFQRRGEKKKSSLEAVGDIIRRLFRSGSQMKKVSPEPYSPERTPQAVQTESLVRKKPDLASSLKARITPRISSRRKEANKTPLFLVTDAKGDASDAYNSGSETLVHKNSMRQSLFSEDNFFGSQKSLLSKRWRDRGSNIISPSPSSEVELVTNQANMTSHSLIDFSQSTRSFLKSEKVKTGSLIFDENEQQLPTNLKRASKSIFNPETQKTLKSGFIGSIHLESPTNAMGEGSSIQNLIQRSPTNIGRTSPFGQFGESQVKIGSLLEVGSVKDLGLEKRGSNLRRPVVLETIPENPKKNSFEEIMEIKIDEPLNFEEENHNLEEMKKKNF